MPTGSEADGVRSVRVITGGPILVDGPVDIETDDGTHVRSDRFVVAICTCRRSKTYPLCDTSHRTKQRVPQSDRAQPISEDDPTDHAPIT